MKKVLKWGGIGFAAILVLALVAFGVVYVTTDSAIAEKATVTPGDVQVPTDAEAIARGKHLVETRGCFDCHGEDYGGRVFVDDPAVGRFVGSNLTKGAGGIGSTYEDRDWVLAIRHGVGADERKLVFMPSYEYFSIDDRDLGQMIAYLKSLPSVDRELSRTTVGPMGRLLYATGEMPLLAYELIDHDAPRKDAPPEGPTAEYGEYLAMGCTGCHGPEFSGGKIPGTPPEWLPASNITPDEATGIGTWTQEDFVAALHEGKRPDGSKLDPRFMPISVTSKLKDHEVTALWKYLKTVPAKAEGGR